MSSTSLLFMVQPAPEVRLAMQQTLAAQGWDHWLADSLCAPAHWHQPLSPHLPNISQVRDRMMDVGAQLDAAAFTVVLNRVRCARAGPDSAELHWSFHSTTKPVAFDALLSSVRSGLEQQGLDGLPGHNPHVTVSYMAPKKLSSTKILPIAWRVDALLLVECLTEPQRFETLGRWPLRPVPQGVESQRDLW